MLLKLPNNVTKVTQRKVTQPKLPNNVFYVQIPEIKFIYVEIHMLSVNACF